MKNLKRLISFILIAFILTAALSAYSDPEWDPVRYSGLFFVLMEPAGPLEPDVYDEEAAIRQLLQEAQYVFSAMIYGFDFEYIPKDNVRGVEEEFYIEPIYTIPWGSPGLRIEAGEYKNGKYTAEMTYDVSESQIPWIKSWETNILPDMKAPGEGRLVDGFEGKKTAINNSVKEAARAYLRSRVYDKPRRISGRARLAEVPYISVDAGGYRSSVKVTLQIEEVLEYETF